jgi:hypothetical protein
MDDRKIIDDLNWLRKKVESLSSNFLNLKNTDESNINNNSNSNRIGMIDSSKFVEFTIFNEFKNYTLKEFENVYYKIDELRKIIDDILLALKSKISDKDLKMLEEFLLLKIDELKGACNKKFADKNETAKNLKYLDSQIKHIIEVYIKKIEKGENWLLAKKPLGGYSCASCEAYIGDLHDNSQYIPWNKYPMRDPNDKLYRIGNGFSKMLQMINLDNNNANKNNFQTSYDFYKNHHADDIKKELNLPKVKSNKKMDMNMSADDVVELDENFRDMDDPMQPKMYFIFIYF